jgi:hypothetical protein
MVTIGHNGVFCLLEVSENCRPNLEYSMYKVCCIVLLLTVAMVYPAAAQRLPESKTVRDPQPEAAIPAIIAAFNAFAIVGIGDIHGTKDINDFFLSLVRHPAVLHSINDIVVEGLDSDLQPTIDQYIAGADVPIEDAKQLWREGSDGANDFKAQLFQLVRRINLKLPPASRVRVLAAEPPPGGGWRDTHIASILAKEVMARNRKALLFYGGGHLNRGVPDQLITIHEAKYPGTTFIVQSYVGGRQRNHCGLPVIMNGTSQDPKMAAWLVPSLLRVKNTWLADFARDEVWSPAAVAMNARLGRAVSPLDPFDAYLYLGPPELMLATELGGRPVVGGRMATADPFSVFSCDPKVFEPTRDTSK